MAESFSCPSCGAKYGWKAELAGKRVRCKKCSGQFVVPAQTPAPPPPAADLADLFAEDAAATSARAAEADPFAQGAAWAPPQTAPERHRALTVDNNTVASNPGGLRIEYGKYLSSYPWMPALLGAIAIFAVLAALVLAVQGKGANAGGWAAGAIAAVVMLGFQLIRAREQFLHGCVCPAVVISVRPYLLAAATDLSTGGGYYPAIKIMSQPLGRMTGGPPELGTRLATVALYAGNANQPHWRDFEPLAVNCVTTDTAEIARILASIPQEEWDMLENGLPQVREPYRSGKLCMLKTG